MKPRPRALLPVAIGLVLLVGACAPAAAPSEAGRFARDQHPANTVA